MIASLVVPHPHASHDARITRSCVRPGCSRRATTTLRFDYVERTVMLDPLGSPSEPGEYDLCLHHAARSTPPTGWTLRDRAPSRESLAEPAPPVGPDRGQGVARLAAALSAVDRAVSEDAPDAAPDGTDRSGGPLSPLSPLAGPSASVASAGSLPPVTPGRPAGVARLDSLLQPSATVAPVPLSERTPEVEVRRVPQPLRLAPDPTTTVWCADLLAQPPTTLPPAAQPPTTLPPAAQPPAMQPPVAPIRAVPSGTPSDGPTDAPTLFG